MGKNKLKKVCIAIVMIIILVLQESVVTAEVKNNNPMLKDIKINGNGIEPEFEMFTTEYVMTVEEHVEKIEIEAIPDDKNATVNIIGDTNLKTGKNEVEIEVIAENGKNKQSYFLYITRGNSESTNANLKGIKIKGSSELAPLFDKNVINYAFEYPESLEKVEIEAIAEDSEAKVEIIGNENLSEIVQNIQIIVTAKDGQTLKTYYLTAKKAGIEVENSEGKEPQEVEELTSLQQKHQEEKAKEKGKQNMRMYLIIGIVAIIILVFTIKIGVERSKKKNEK